MNKIMITIDIPVSTRERQQEDMLRADMIAQERLKARGVIDPRLTIGMAPLERYDAMRAYDDLLAFEKLKCLREFPPREKPKDSKPFREDWASKAYA